MPGTAQGTRFRGVSASRGIAIGSAHLMEARVVVSERRILRAERKAELLRLEEAIRTADQQLDDLRASADTRGRRRPGPDRSA
jgi:phosphoenolpyruvate-protein kinase (PTS system EI component)